MPFYVFEGCDRSGKSTQSTRLAEHLRAENKIVHLLKYPDRNSQHTGALISDFLAGRTNMSPGAASLLLAANLWEMIESAKEFLNRAEIVIMDRYVWSNVAYSLGRGMDGEVFARVAEGLPTPDRTFFLSIDPQLLASRSGFGAERYERVDFQRTVATTMEALAKTANHPVSILDATQTPQEIFAQILEIVQTQ